MSRRKKAYLSLALSLVLVITQYVLILVLELSPSDASGTDYVVQLLKVLAFIWINLGIYQLYNPTGRWMRFTTYGLTVLALILTAIPFSPLDAEISVFSWLSSRWLLESLLLVMILSSFFTIRPYIGQHAKYIFSLVLFFCIQGSQMLNTYMYDGQHHVLQALVNYLPVVYYGTLFMIVFDRIVELLYAVYQSSILDGLTGVYNRNYIIHYVHTLMKKRRGSVIFCDIDNFKRLNDTQGHQTGDAALKAVAAIMMEVVEGRGKVGRYGGEEMIAVLEDTSAAVAKTAELIRKRIEERTNVTVSVGYSRYRKGISAYDLLKEADEAMYVSKKTGKNKVTAYSSKLPKLLELESPS
jgi:diguanylate cyclase (GGDEF)-like protein